MILSASRRTDIPAFYGEWFLNRLEQEYAYVRNPMNSGMISSVPLSPDNVDCIVFWTKDPRPFLDRLKKIDAMGYKYYFQFTITGYCIDAEAGIADREGIIKSFVDLSDRIGRERIILRYDPVFVTEDDRYDIEFHISAFNDLCQKLSPYTERVVFSFLDSYRKILTNMRRLKVRELGDVEMTRIAEGFSSIAGALGLSLETCAESIDLKRYGISQSRCINGDLIERIIGAKITGKDKRDGTRAGCNCMKSIDIGQYDTCIHDCMYCYANASKEKARENYRLHVPSSPILAGKYDADKVKMRNEKDTASLLKNYFSFDYTCDR